MDIFARTSPGDPINGDPAAFYNATIDVVQDWLRKRKHMSAPAELKLPSALDVMIRNTGDTPLPQFSIVRLGTPLNVPRGDVDFFYGHAVFDAAAPLAGKAFAVLQMPASKDAIARVVFSGPTLARVEFTDLAHDYADLIAGDTLKLRSHASTGARVLWKDTPTGSQLDGAIDEDDEEIDIDAADAERWPDPEEVGEYVIGIDSELLLVTARDGYTFEVERGHADTEAATHADNSSLVFTSGTVWALLLLDESRPRTPVFVRATDSYDGGYGGPYGAFQRFGWPFTPGVLERALPYPDSTRGYRSYAFAAVEDIYIIVTTAPHALLGIRYPAQETDLTVTRLWVSITSGNVGNPVSDVEYWVLTLGPVASAVAWTDDIDYPIGSVVAHGGVTYVRIISEEEAEEEEEVEEFPEPPNSDYWQALTTDRGSYGADVTYTAGEFVSRDYDVWLALPGPSLRRAYETPF